MGVFVLCILLHDTFSRPLAKGRQIRQMGKVENNPVNAVGER